MAINIELIKSLNGRSEHIFRKIKKYPTIVPIIYLM